MRPGPEPVSVGQTPPGWTKTARKVAGLPTATMSPSDLQVSGFYPMFGLIASSVIEWSEFFLTSVDRIIIIIIIIIIVIIVIVILLICSESQRLYQG